MSSSALQTAKNRLLNMGIGSTQRSLSSVALNKTSAARSKPFRVCVIGSGNWGTTIAKVVSENTFEQPNLFEEEVRMWVFEEKINGKPLTHIINTEHENVKYLPEVKLPRNLIADPSIVNTVKDADIIIFNIPHQFLPNIVKQLKGNVPLKARAISCLKGLEVEKDGVHLLSDYIHTHLGITCGALSGANLAPEVAREKYSETTIAYRLPADYFDGDVNHSVLRALFHRKYFHVRVIEDVSGVSVAGALKNVVALAAGFVEGLGWGDNAKSAIMRRGLVETVKFSFLFFPESQQKTFTEESCGVADLITTSYGGRNVKIGREMAKTGKTARQLEIELLNGQSAQGIITAKEVHDLLENKKLLKEFPLFEATYQIVYNGADMIKLPEMIEDDLE